MKKYIQPRILMEGIIEDELIIATSGEGVTTFSLLGNEHNKDDVSYSKGRSGYSADYSLRDGWE